MRCANCGVELVDGMACRVVDGDIVHEYCALPFEDKKLGPRLTSKYPWYPHEDELIEIYRDQDLFHLDKPYIVISTTDDHEINASGFNTKKELIEYCEGIVEESDGWYIHRIFVNQQEFKFETKVTVNLTGPLGG